MPHFSVLIPWANRRELLRTLREHRELFSRHGVETIVVNGGGDWEMLRELLDQAAVPGTRAIDLPGVPFNRSLCMNIGALASRGEYLFHLDADALLTSDLFAAALPHLRSSPCYVAVRRYLETEPKAARSPDGNTNGSPDWSFLNERIDTTELLTTDGRRIVLRRTNIPGKTKAGDGLVIVRKADMLKVGGLNSGLTGWGYEDSDFQIRLQWVLQLERVELGDVLHLTHELSGDALQSWTRNMHASTRLYSSGDLQGTLDQDASRWQPALDASATR